MEESAAKMLTLSDLFLQRRPLSGASSISSTPSRRTPCQNHREEAAGAGNPSSALKILTPMNNPIYLIGTVTLPVYNDGCDSSAPPTCPIGSANSGCFRFYDGHSLVCCDVVDFSVPMLGEKIQVLAFNFIPFKRGGGFLEIVKWTLFSSSKVGGLLPCSSKLSFPLHSGNSSGFDHSAKAGYNILGSVESVCPVFSMPCPAKMESNGKNLRGFLAEFKICVCRLCKSKCHVEELVSNLAETHVYSETVFVFFCGSASPWHPAITKLIGSAMVLSGLKKKLMYVRKEESQVVFVVTEKSLMYPRRMSRKCSGHVKTGIKGDGECGNYRGIVTGVYMQGTVVELDMDVWLLLTDHQLVLTHSMRIGAVIAVKNAHFVRAKFAFTKGLILGCCFKSSIIVESFSPLEAGCYVMPHKQSILGNFLSSLSFSARLWMLLAVSCFHKKFTDIISEKEILGVKRKEGLSQVYARSCLPSWAVRSRHGIFFEVCKHNYASCCGPEPYDDPLKLAVPLSIFILFCESMWSNMPRVREQAHEELDKSDKDHRVCCRGRTHCQPIRMIIPSQDIGIILLGTLRISSACGRLQFFDATGSIDVLIPDLPSTWKPNSLYEISEYSLIIDGASPSTSDHSKENIDTFSCKRIFTCTVLRRDTTVGIFIYFYLRNATCRDIPFLSCDANKEKHVQIHGKLHMLQVVHKFPLLDKDDQLKSEISSAFAEAVVLPWNVFLSGKSSGDHFCKAVGNSAQISRKRKKTNGRSLTHSSMSGDDASDLEFDGGAFSISSCDGDISGFMDTNSHKIPCLAAVRNVNNIVPLSSGILYSINGKSKTGSICKSSTQKILIEFKLSDLSKYQGLQIGGYYIVKIQGKNSLSRFLDSDHARGQQILVASETMLWSLSIMSSDNLIDNGSTIDAPFSKFHFSSSEIILGHGMISPTEASGYTSVSSFDIYLLASKELLVPLELDLKETQFRWKILASSLEENVSCYNGSGISLPLSSKASGFGFPFPHRNLLCIRGDVISVHDIKSHKELVSIDQPEHFRGDICRVSIHVLMGNHTVEIFGYLRKHARPIGLGPGAHATFYRVLDLSALSRFLLTPESFIEIHDVKMMTSTCLPQPASACSTFAMDSFVVPSIVSSDLISELALSSGSNSIKLRFKVIGVPMFILETDSGSDCLTSKLKCGLRPPFDIPVAAFAVEDGSSSCICWADGERALALLRLSETLPRTTLSSYRALKWAEQGNNNSASSYHNNLERILKKHGRIIMKNHASQNGLSKPDNCLLQNVIKEACSGIELIVVGNVLDSAAAEILQEEHFGHVVTRMDSQQHLWVREVHSSDPLEEARRTIAEFLKDANDNRRF